MSEEKEKKNEMNISVEIDPKAIEDRMTEMNNLKSENEELRESLSIIAEKEFRAKAEKLGLENLDPNDPDDIEKLKQAEYDQSHKAPIGGTTAPLNQYQINDYSEKKDSGFDSMEEAVLFANKMSEYSPEMKKQLGKTAKRALKKGDFDYELEPTYNPATGKEGCLQVFRKPTLSKISKDTYEDLNSLEQRKQAKKLEQKWEKKD